MTVQSKDLLEFLQIMRKLDEPQKRELVRYLRELLKEQKGGELE